VAAPRHPVRAQGEKSSGVDQPGIGSNPPPHGDDAGRPTPEPTGDPPMPPSRRSVVLAAAFLGLACLLVGGRSAHAQRQRPPYGPPPPPRGPEMQPFGPQYGQRTHDIWEPQVSADEVRDAFKRGRPGNSGELPPGFEKLVPG